MSPKMVGIKGSGMFKTCSHLFFTFTDSYLQYKNVNNFQRRMSTINDPSPPFFVHFAGVT